MLVLSDRPLTYDRRVQASIEAYRALGWQVRFLDVNSAAAQAGGGLGLLGLLGLSGGFLRLWLACAVRVLPTVAGLWTSGRMRGYRLFWLGLPRHVWRDIAGPLRRGRRFRDKPGLLADVARIHAHDLQALVFANGLLAGAAIPVTYDAHEFSAHRNRFCQSGLTVALIAAGEAAAMVRADRVAGVSRPQLAWLRLLAGRTGQPTPASRRWALLHNQFYADETGARGVPDQAAKRAMIYIGSLGRGRGMAALQALAARYPGLDVLIYCPEDTAEQRARAALLRPSANLSLIFGPYAERIVADLAPYAAVFGWLYLEDRCLSYRFATPNKLFQYAGLGVDPVLPPGLEIARIAARHGIGQVRTLEALMAEGPDCLTPTARARLRAFHTHATAQSYAGQSGFFA